MWRAASRPRRRLRVAARELPGLWLAARRRASPVIYAGKASWWMLGMLLVLVWIVGA
jgi:hypothetical protein